MSAAAAVARIRILLVDDSPLIRLGLRAALEDHATITIVGEAGNAADGLSAAAHLRPDVVLLDLRLPDLSGLAACRRFQALPTPPRVLILTSSTDEQNVQLAVAAGALGYLLKDNDSATLAAAITQVAAGRSVLDASLAEQLMQLMRQSAEGSASAKLRALSAQERKVVALLTDGLTNKEIGDRLGLTEKTVKNYLATVFDKLGITRRAQAAALFVEAGRRARE